VRNYFILNSLIRKIEFKIINIVNFLKIYYLKFTIMNFNICYYLKNKLENEGYIFLVTETPTIFYFSAHIQIIAELIIRVYTLILELKCEISIIKYLYRKFSSFKFKMNDKIYIIHFI